MKRRVFLLVLATALVAAGSFKAARGEAAQGKANAAEPPAALQSILFDGGLPDPGSCLAVDSRGAVYLAGSTTSAAFPTTSGAYDRVYHDGGSFIKKSDVFVAKFDSGLKTLLACTLLGGTGDDIVRAIAIAPSGDIVVAGTTSSADFPTTAESYSGALAGATDVFIAILDPDLTTLRASTYLGGAGKDEASSLAIDAEGAVYVAGWTDSTDYPVSLSAFRTVFSGWTNGVVSKLDLRLETLVASTFIGGSIGSTGVFLALDPAGKVVVAGATGASDFPVTPGAFSSEHHGSSDGFVSKYEPDLSSMIASTLFGGSFLDTVSAVGVDPSGFVYVGGYTESGDLPVPEEGFQTFLRSFGSGYLVRFDPDLARLAGGTFLGGKAAEMVKTLAVSLRETLYAAGRTRSKDFPVTPGAFDTTFNSLASDMYDAFVVEMDAGLRTLLGSTLIGGLYWDGASSLVVEVDGNVVVAGITHSDDFPAAEKAYRPPYSGGPYIIKLPADLSAPAPNPEIRLDPDRIDFGAGSVGVLSLVKTFRVMNTAGEDRLQIRSLRLGGDCEGDFQIVEETCAGRELGPGEACQGRAVFFPFATGPRSGWVVVTSDDPDTPEAKVLLSGVAFSSQIAVVPGALDFGGTPLGTDMERPLLVRNDGEGLLILKSVEAPAEPFEIVFDQCSGMTLSEGRSCLLLVRFSPVVAGPAESSLRIRSNDPDDPVIEVALRGTGLTLLIEVLPREIDFGPVAQGGSATRAVEVRNAGTGFLTLSALVAPALPFSLGGGTCAAGLLLGPGEGCSLEVRFVPAAAGSFVSEIGVESDATDSPSVAVTLRGRSGPDLAGRWRSVSRGCKEKGGTLRCKLAGEIEIENRGTADASSTVAFFLSEKGALEAGGEPLKSFKTGKIRAKAAKVKKVAFNLPAGTSGSGRFLFGVLDEENLVAEADETNNVVVYGPLP